ncbi:Sphingosine 1-phosphate receptor 3 [Mizuhopecten yessoensis]|uniref:Sphingosine 1-phosphate receptor 3 n=1 Tax=Mizuhopecten yessoensis TaxID=6573 RepID=A0A210PLG2_MIZYE|nr:Sphingosine 1-phosphate receptor 3 [Mizuhopecten yessoensis]
MNGSRSINWNMTSTNSLDESTFSTEVTVFPLIVGFLTCVIILISNLLVLIVLICQPEIRKNYRIEFILWLCLSDIVVGISGLLFVCNFLIKGLSKNTHYCSLMYYFIAAGIGQSLAQTFLICIDRHMAVVANVRYKLFNKKYRYIVIFGTWVFIHTYVGTLVAVFMRTDYITYCSAKSFPYSKLFLTAINVLFLSLLLAIPCLYISTMISFRNRSKRTHNYPNVILSVVNSAPSSQSTQNIAHFLEKNKIRHKYEKHVLVTTGLIVVVFLLLNGPFLFIIIFLEGNDFIAVQRSTRILISLMTFLNSAVNPMLYAWRIRKVRQIFIKFICRCKTNETQQY